MLAEYLSIPFRKELFTRIFGDQIRRHGCVSLALCGAVAESIGLQTQLIELESSELKRIDFPLLITWGDGLAIIYRQVKDKLLIAIPSSGIKEIECDNFTEQWGETGNITC